MVKKALIIAAGRGSRLDDLTDDVPKPLVKLCGMPLLDRIMHISGKEGIEEFYIVVGHKKEVLKEYYNTKKHKFKITWIDNDEWEKANGVSVLAAADYLKDDNFVLMMSDHIFEPDNISSLMKKEEELKKNGIILAVDSSFKDKAGIDLDDATKINIEDERVTAIGKELEEYTSLDTGMFLCSPELFKVLKRLYKKNGDCSLSDGNMELIKKGKFGYHEIGMNMWQDVDTKSDLKAAEKKILNKCRKPTDGIVSRNFNRYISLFFSSFLCKTPITPNQISVMVLSIGILSAYLITTQNYLLYALGLILYKMTSIMDGCDGEIAKLKYMMTDYGEWVDTACDNITTMLFFWAIGYANYQAAPTPFNYSLMIAAPVLYGFSVSLILVILKVFEDTGSIVALNTQFKQRNKFFAYFGELIRRDFFATLFTILGLLMFQKTILFLGIVSSIGILIYSVIKPVLNYMERKK